MRRGQWCQREIDLLRQHYPKGGPSAVIEALSAEGFHRTRTGVVAAAYQRDLTGARGQRAVESDRERAPRVELPTHVLLRAIDGVRLSAMRIADDLTWTLAKMTKLIAELDRRMEDRRSDESRVTSDE